MKIEQFYDEGLSHASYCILSDRTIAVIDPGRDPKPYYEFAKTNNAEIIAIIETHPHADFVSSHLEIHKATGAIIYVSKLTRAAYPHTTFDQGDQINLGKLTLKAFNTPGHSPDSISILLLDKNNKNTAVFSGDTLFIGDVGRPDLREKAGKQTGKREELARLMYHSTRNILMKLEKDVMIYPAHGAGSLCGKNMSSELSSTLGQQLDENQALRDMPEEEFVEMLLADQPFIPKYFSYNVNLNNIGAPDFKASVASVPRLSEGASLNPDVWIIDTRPQALYKKGHIKKSINIMDGAKFETWLGAIVSPEEHFYLLAEHERALEIVIEKTAKIGYEKNIEGALLVPAYATEESPLFDLPAFKENPDQYTIVDIRNAPEVQQGKLFDNALSIPLHELRERAGEISNEKPVVVHCAGGYRSAAGSSILENILVDIPVYDMREAVKNFSD